MSGQGNLIDTNFPLNIQNGGTAASSFVAYTPVCGGTSTTSALQSVSSVGSSGQVLLSQGAGALPVYGNVSGAVVQIHQYILTTMVHLSSPTGWTDSGVTVNITPTNTSSKVLILYSLGALAYDGGNSQTVLATRLLRSGTAINLNTDATVINASTVTDYNIGAGYPLICNTVLYVDSPSSTASLTYKIQVFPLLQSNGTADGDVYINALKGGSTADGGTSSIIVMELAT